MAEGLVALGLVANIVQLVVFSSKILHRLNDFSSSSDEIPESLHRLKIELFLLRDTLQQIQKAIDAASAGTQQALVLAVDDCLKQAEQLNGIVVKSLPVEGDGKWKKAKKAFISVLQGSEVERIREILQRSTQVLTFYYVATTSNLKPVADERLSKLRQWLQAPDPSTNHRKALKQRQIDTGLWLLESERYAQWRTDATSLWLDGTPGCGKTIMSSTVIQDVLQYCNDDPGKVVAYFYFDFKDVEKQDPERMIRSLICQLSHQCVKIPEGLDPLLSSCDDERQPSLDVLLDVVQHMIQAFPQTYIILDALDECANKDGLLEILETMARWQLLNLHLMVTSRPEADIKRSLEGFVDAQNMISLHTALVDKDIRKYVRQRLSDDQSLAKWQRVHEVREEIETEVTKRADGMFRWAVCQLDTLAKCPNRLEVQEALATLPPTLDDTYDRILCAIEERNVKYALRILRWLAFSSRSLSPEELSEAIAIDVERDPAFERQEVLEEPLDVLKICSSLVTIASEYETSRERDWRGDYDKWEPVRQVVVLAHYSVKEYLTSERIRQGPASRYSMQDAPCREVIAKSCLEYLLQLQQPDLLTRGNIREFKLARYSALFWTNHAKAVVEEEEEEEAAEALNPSVLKFFGTRDGAYLNWIRIFDPDNPWRYYYPEARLDDVPTPLYYAAQAGLTGIVTLLLSDSEVDVNAAVGRQGNALKTASAEGHYKIVELLLDRGADINATGGWYCNALGAASAGGHDKIVELLLSRGAQVNTGRLRTSAMYEALAGGHYKIVELLLSKGTDVKTGGGGQGYGNALQVASAKCHVGIVELLLSRGAQVNTEGRYANALSLASARGRIEIVELLLSRGADINARGEYHDNALGKASAMGHVEIVELLLNRGADINAIGREEANALGVASAMGQVEVVELLVSRGAQINGKAGFYGSALQVASWEGQDKIVKLLLSKGVEVNMRGGRYGNALQLASFWGHEKIVELLLSNGAEVNAQGEYICGNALHAASGEGRNKVVELLLSKGADINAEGPHGNALSVASTHGRDKIVELLLSQGAKVSPRALEVASQRGHDMVVGLLISMGTNVLVREKRSETAHGKSYREYRERGIRAMARLLSGY